MPLQHRLIQLSKELQNLNAAIAPNFAYYNLYKTHDAIRTIPALAAIVAASAWLIAKLVKRYG